MIKENITEVKNQVLEAFEFRHACKEFDANKKISESDFNYILETARLSPSSFGFEPWKFVVLQNPEIREKIKPFCHGAQGQLPTASHFVLILSRKTKDMKFDSDFIMHMMKEVKHLPEEIINFLSDFYKKFQEEDFKLLESERAMGDWASKQTYIALANMMTAAALIGVDSCPMEGFIPEDVERILSEEGILDKESYNLSVMVAFGYRKTYPQFPKTRQNLDKIVQWV